MECVVYYWADVCAAWQHAATHPAYICSSLVGVKQRARFVTSAAKPASLILSCSSW